MRLNIGCGPDIRPGWVNIDRDVYFGLDWRGDVLTGLPWPDETFDGAVANHVLQMVAYPDIVPWLNEVRRVLKPDARLRLLVPDLLGAISAFHDRSAGWFPIDDTLEPDINGKLCLYVSQAGATRSVFTGPWMTNLCDRALFADSVVIESSATLGPSWLTELDSRHHESIIVEARK